MFATSWRHSSKKGNAGPSGVSEWHSGGFSEMTLRGLGWIPRGLRVYTRWTLWGLGWTPRGQSGWMWFMPSGRPSVTMTWMVDCMDDMIPWGQPSVERHGWLIGWVRTTFPIVE